MNKIKPSVTDSRIITFNDDQYCYAPIVKPLNKLLVFLPGSGAMPSGATLWMEAVQAQGYHGIALSYPNSKSGVDCKSVKAPTNTYLDNFCREVLFGEQLSPISNVDTINCIESRLLKLLQYLDNLLPLQGWDQYYDSGGLIYSKLTASGHSQGGSHAAKWGQYKKLQRVICVSSPREVCNYKSVWSNFATPLSDYFFFTHTEDKFPDQDFLIKSMGVTAPYVDTYKVTDQTKWGKYLVTSYPVTTKQPAHKITLTDPIFSTQWAYLLK